MALNTADLLEPHPEGIYCPAGDFWIDPMRPKPRALITHGHADHARAGHGAVLASRETLEIMAIRYGEDFTQHRQVAEGEIRIGGVNVSFHPAGHILGSCQIRIRSDKGPVIVASGDYSRRANPVCAPFEPLDCDIFITEATFGLPVFRHLDPLGEAAKLLKSMADFPERPHIIGGYALGKTQRLIALLHQAGYEAPIGLHGALMRLSRYHQEKGIPLGDLVAAADAPQLIIAPPSALGSPWAQRFPDPVLGYASGWMGVRSRAKARRVELPLVISDHVDWPEVTATLREIAPEEVWITHGAEDGLLRWCALQGMTARPLHLEGYEDSDNEPAEPEA